MVPSRLRAKEENADHPDLAGTPHLMKVTGARYNPGFGLD
jgi:hypothetical protein